MADDLGAVRRTPRPTGDRQTPETATQESAGTTNTASSVSGDQLAVSSRVSSQGEPAFQAATLAVLEALNPMGDDPVYPTRSTEFAAYVAEQVEQALIGAGWRRPRPDHEAALAALRAAILENPESISFAGPECDMEAYAALPPCTACEGGGQDTHGTVFEAPLAVHFAGPYVTIGGRRRQLCAWCGHVLLDVQLAPGQEHEPWFDVKLVRVEDGTTTRQPYTYGDPLPPGCCALPDDGEPTPGPGCYPPADGWDGVSTVGGEPADLWTPTVGDRVTGVETQTISQPTVTGYFHSSGMDGLSLLKIHADDPETAQRYLVATSSLKPCTADEPDEAQETRAAADWPAEPVDTPAEGDHV